MKFEWEQIEKDDSSNRENFYSETFRAKVFGGWIVKSIYLKDYDKLYTEKWKDLKLSMVFVPDHEHKWDIE